MTALSLTPQTATASVLIEITGAPAGAVIITRTDVNGTNVVRLLEDQEPISGSLTITDYEPALIGTLTYDVQDSANTITTENTTFVDLTQPHLVVPVLPLFRQELEYVTGFGSTREMGGTVHEIVDRPDPIPVLRPLKYRNGTLEFWASEYLVARNIEKVCAQGEVVLLKQPTFEGMDFYFVPLDVSLRPNEETYEGRRWMVSVGYQEVRSPIGPLMSASDWTFADVAANYSTFAEQELAFTTFNDLLVGP